jgi:WD40 repeat protein
MLDFRELLGDGLHGAARILVAMGPSAAETAPVLIEILENDRSQGRRQLAARILGTFGPKAEPAIPALSETAADEKNLLLLRQEADDVLKKLNATAAMRSITNEGKVIWLPLQHASQVQAVAFSHDGSLLATASSPPNGNSTIRLWDVKTGAEKAPLREDHRRLTDCLAFSPDDKSLASSGGSVVIWNLETRRPHNVDAHKFASGDLAFSPDGSTLAIAGPDDREIALWDLKNDKLAGVLRGHKGYVRSVAFAPDGKTLVSGGNDVPNVRIWDVPSRRQLAALSHPAYAEAVAYFPDGKWFAAGNSFGDNTVRIWDAISHKERRVLRGHTQFIHAIAISPDGTTLASAGDDATIRLWETATGAERTVFKGHFGPVYALSFSRDGSLLASGGADNTVRLWSVAMRNGRR